MAVLEHDLSTTTVDHAVAATRVALLGLASACDVSQLQTALADLPTDCRFCLVGGGEVLSAQERAERLITTLCDPSIDVVWALRGGCGSADCLPFLHEHRDQLLACRPKLLVGYSDITALLLYVSQQLAWPVLHAPVARDVWEKNIDPDSINNLMQILEKKQHNNHLSLTAINVVARVPASFDATLTGGNLCLVNLSMGDINEIQTDDRVVVLEDTNDAVYVVQRGLNYLSRIGKLKKCRALLLGDFLLNGQHPVAMQQMLDHFAEQQSIPVLRIESVGHGACHRALPFAVPVDLQMGDQASLSWSTDSLWQGLKASPQ